MRIENLTDHVVILDEGKVFFPSGSIARCKMRRRVMGSINGVPVCKVYWEPVRGLPPQRKGTMYIVSQIVFDRTDRKDLLAPDTGKGSVVKDGEGRTIAVKKLRVKDGFEQHAGVCYKSIKEVPS